MRFCKIKNHKHIHKEFFEKAIIELTLKCQDLLKNTFDI